MLADGDGISDLSDGKGTSPSCRFALARRRLRITAISTPIASNAAIPPTSPPINAPSSPEGSDVAGMATNETCVVASDAVGVDGKEAIVFVKVADATTVRDVFNGIDIIATGHAR